MRLCRFGDNRLGVVEGSVIRDVSEALDVLPACRWPFPPGDVFISHLDRVIQQVKLLRDAAPSLPISEVKLQSPVANPSKIIAAPVNYQKHLDEVKGDKQLHQNTQAHTITIQQAGLFLEGRQFAGRSRRRHCAASSGAA